MTDPLRPRFEHWIVALENKRHFDEQMGGHIFFMLHDKLTHECRIGKDCQTVAEEWSRLSHEEALVFLLCGGTAVEQVQRFIAAGVLEPYEIPLGPLVERPEWAKIYEWRQSG